MNTNVNITNHKTKTLPKYSNNSNDNNFSCLVSKFSLSDTEDTDTKASK